MSAVWVAAASAMLCWARRALRFYWALQVGPSGPVQFHQPAYAFLGHHAHAHVAALNAIRHHPVATASFQPAPTVPIQYGVHPDGCITGPSGKVCPTGNIQFT
ncbi:hypothetical protein Hamer_G017523 [Homarus americanus]|uniref:Secreted protein n=1 Tax=Homarus americanus TaxID=6706 RepID=A0A8J5JJP7_HOMAM|nr:hypothetical protein Hamer_G017523 [Homarus americanus]